MSLLGYKSEADVPLPAIQKFVEAMNRNTLYWTKTVTINAKAGKIETIHYEGEVYKDDPGMKQFEEKLNKLIFDNS